MTQIQIWSNKNLFSFLISSFFFPAFHSGIYVKLLAQYERFLSPKLARKMSQIALPNMDFFTSSNPPFLIKPIFFCEIIGHLSTVKYLEMKLLRGRHTVNKWTKLFSLHHYFENGVLPPKVNFSRFVELVNEYFNTHNENRSWGKVYLPYSKMKKCGK